MTARARHVLASLPWAEMSLEAAFDALMREGLGPEDVTFVQRHSLASQVGEVAHASDGTRFELELTGPGLGGAGSPLACDMLHAVMVGDEQPNVEIMRALTDHLGHLLWDIYAQVSPHARDGAIDALRARTPFSDHGALAMLWLRGRGTAWALREALHQVVDGLDVTEVQWRSQRRPLHAASRCTLGHAALGAPNRVLGRRVVRPRDVLRVVLHVPQASVRAFCQQAWPKTQDEAPLLWRVFEAFVPMGVDLDVCAVMPRDAAPRAGLARTGLGQSVLGLNRDGNDVTLKILVPGRNSAGVPAEAGGNAHPAQSPHRKGAHAPCHIADRSRSNGSQRSSL